MRPPDNCLVFRIWRRPPKTIRKGKKRMSTGPPQTRPKKMGWDVVANVTQTSEMSKAKKAAVSRNGSRSRAAGLLREV